MIISQFGELYGFGANDTAQLGVGLHIPNNNAPERLKKLSDVSRRFFDLSGISLNGTVRSRRFAVALGMFLH